MWIKSVFLWASVAVLAGTASGAEFAVTFMANSIDDEFQPPLDVELYVAPRDAGTPLQVSIMSPSDPLFIPINLTAFGGQVQKRTLPAATRLAGSGTIETGKAYRVIADGDAIVYAMNRNKYSTDGFAVFRVDLLGMEYYTVSYAPSDLLFSQFAFIAVEEGMTRVNVSLPVGFFGSVVFGGQTYGGGDQFTVTLGFYETIQIQSNVNLAGTKLVGDKPIAVFSGNDRVALGDGRSRDHLAEQLPAVNQWGREFYAVPTPQRTRGDLLRILAAYPDTTVRISAGDGSPTQVGVIEKPALLWSGPEIKTAVFISSDKPVMVVAASQTRDKNDPNDEGDPSMVIIPSVEQYSNNYVFATPTYTKPEPAATTDDYTNYVLVVANDSDTSGLLLNDSPFTSQWRSISSETAYQYTVMTVDSTTRYTLKHPNSTAKYMAWIYGAADRETYYLPIAVEYEVINIVDPGSAEVFIYGDKGETGLKGAQGLKGTPGTTGNMGDPGAQGVTGIKGANGPQGPNGESGQNGGTGMKGDKGDTGIVGLPGLKGGAGGLGSEGVTGLRGPTGVKGVLGSLGNNGEVGLQGQMGAKGVAGGVGQKGPTGEKGEKGSLGVRGSVGRNGAAGQPGFIDGGGCSPNPCRYAHDQSLAVCVPVFGSRSYYCECQRGFAVSRDDSKLCVDVDECSSEFCTHGCTNTIGSYSCSCPPGYSQYAGNQCTDEDECQLSGDTCSTNEACLNSIGSFLCIGTSQPSSSAQVSTDELSETFQGVQVLLNENFYLIVIAWLALLSIIITVLFLYLAARSRKRNSHHKRRRAHASAQMVNLPPSIIGTLSRTGYR